MRKHVWIAMPSYSKRPDLRVTNAAIGLLAQLDHRGIEAEYKQHGGNGITHHARNNIAANFFASKATDLMFCDDDNWTDVEGFISILSAPGDVIGAPIRKKQDDMAWNVGWLPDRAIEIDEHGRIEVESIGGGILRITREAVRRLIDADPENWYKDNATAHGQAHMLFDYLVKDRTFYGEDTSFCHRWRDIGGKVYIIPNVTTHHLGEKIYSGNMEAWLQACPGMFEHTDVGSGSRSLIPNIVSAQSATPRERGELRKAYDVAKKHLGLSA